MVSEQTSFDLLPYARFIEALTARGGAHQGDALHIALRYLLGGRYPNLAALAAENWDRSEAIREHYSLDRGRFDAAQQLGPLLAASVDHATGTGKSYVIFGAAMVALASGEVDRVLVLCPSNTIEDGLTRKFRDLAARAELMDLLPADAAVRVADIVNAYEGTVPSGAICVENIHAAYERSASSIRDSFEGRGERTLIVNDEAHHIYTLRLGSGRAKEWRNFLLDPAFGFRRVLNVSGTCFIDDAYFPDVIHRYSLQQARSERRIKDIRYWETGSDFASDSARWSAILDNHAENQRRYPGTKPITVFVTDTVSRARQIHADFTAYLAATLGLDDAAAAARTLIVSSAPDHRMNLPILRTVDAEANTVEFIFSVSMLTEGWDVKSVLQIVPHEKRAFNSKLLISQVLGRGLRVLPGYPDARVTIFNHATWAPEIRRLFDDVWLDDQRISSSPITGSPYHFELEALDVVREPSATSATATPVGRSAGQPLRLAPQLARETFGVLIDLGGLSEDRRYRHTEPTRSLDDLVGEIGIKLALPLLETGLEEPDETPAIRAEIEAAMRDQRISGNEISETNERRTWEWLRPPVRGGLRMTVRVSRERLTTRTTRDLSVGTVGRSELDQDAAIGLLVDNDQAIHWPGHESGQYDLLDRIIADEERPAGAVRAVTREQAWRTPVDVVIVRYAPERAFLRELLEQAERCGIRAWLKSPDSGFYAVPFTLTRAGVTRNQNFNPDWFLLVGNDILVVETKIDGDTSEENRAKLRDALAYFSSVNRLRSCPGRYHFFFLSPSDYAAFFDAVHAGTYATFLSRLQSDLT